jgi:hypothetical protein
MSLFSEDRIEGIADRIYKELLKKGLIKKEIRSFQFGAAVNRGYTKFYKINDEVEVIVKKRISSMAKVPIQDSAEYKVLFEKQFAEEWKKH